MGEIVNWRTWSVGAVDGHGQPFCFLVSARDRNEARTEAEPDLAGLRVTAVEPL